MPLYDYKCKTCGTFEQWLRLADFDRPVCCPQCEQIAQRMFSPPAILSSGTLSKIRDETQEPRRVERRDREPQPPRNQAASGRPWMIHH